MVGIIYNSKSTLGLTDTCGCGEKTEQNKLVMLSVIIEDLPSSSMALMPAVNKL